MWQSWCDDGSICLSKSYEVCQTPYICLTWISQPFSVGLMPHPQYIVGVYIAWVTWQDRVVDGRTAARPHLENVGEWDLGKQVSLSFHTIVLRWQIDRTKASKMRFYMLWPIRRLRPIEARVLTRTKTVEPSSSNTFVKLWIFKKSALGETRAKLRIAREPTMSLLDMADTNQELA